MTVTVQVAEHGRDLLRVDRAVDHPVAVRTDATKRPGGVARHHVFGHFPSGNLRRAARQAVDAARTAGLLGARPPLGKEAANFRATDHGRALTVDWL